MTRALQTPQPALPSPQDRPGPRRRRRRPGGPSAFAEARLGRVGDDVAVVAATLQSPRYRRLLADVPGCVTTRTGEQRAVA